MVRNPRYATAVGLLEEARLAARAASARAQQAGSVKTLFGRKEWFKGNF